MRFIFNADYIIAAAILFYSWYIHSTFGLYVGFAFMIYASATQIRMGLEK